MTKKKINEVIELLEENYPSVRCYLNYSNPFELLVATILSAQCTDDRVNKITEKLFVKYDTIEKFEKADTKEFEQDIFTAGFYKNKAKNIIQTANIVLNEYNSEVPSDIESLIKLKGVGRKTANVVRSNIFNIPSIVVDTHVKRLSNRIGFTKEEDPVKVEFDLMKKLPEDKWININFQFISHGRKICTSRSPKCEICFLNKLCNYYKKK